MTAVVSPDGNWVKRTKDRDGSYYTLKEYVHNMHMHTLISIGICLYIRVYNKFVDVHITYVFECARFCVCRKLAYSAGTVKQEHAAAWDHEKLSSSSIIFTRMLT